MEVLKVCRICLVTDANMCDLRTQPLETYFGSVMGTMRSMELLPFACFLCASLAKKYYYFRDSCLRSQAALYGILRTSEKITKQEIQQINCSNVQLSPNLTKHTISEDNVINVVYDENDSCEIKKEPALNDNHKCNIKESVKEEECCDDVSLCMMTTSEDSSKEECLDDLSQLSTDNDEPLLLQTRNKVKKGKGNQENEKNKVKLEKKKVAADPLSNTKYAGNETEIPEGNITEIPENNETEIPAGINKNTFSKVKKSCSRKSVSKKQRSTSDILVGELEDYVTIVKLSIEEQMEEINKRQKSSNYLNAPYQCKLCYKGFIDTHAWKHHLSKHDPSAGDMECSICKIRFKSKYVLNRHATNHEKKYICKSCSYVSTSTVQAKRHERWHKGVIYKCQYCDDILTKWTSYLSHVRIKHPSEFICGICGYSFFSKLGLNMHKSRMHKDTDENNEGGDDNEAGLYCKECDVRFKSVEAFQRHMVTSVKHTHTTNVTNGCRECGETFRNPEELTNHRKIHARKVPKYYGKKSSDITWPVKCEHCSEEISNGRDYWNHYRRVHPDKDYPVKKNHVCDICGKSFKSNTFLVYHKRTHSEERAFKCSTCGKAFHNNGNLQLHQKTHSDARPHPCTLCFKAFKCKGALSKHYRRHKGEKPYECQICGKAFTESSGRKLHIRTVHLKQPAPRRSRLQRKKTS